MDAIILQALRERNKFRQLRSAVPDALVGQETVGMLGWFNLYFNTFPDIDYIEVDALRSLFNTRASQYDPEQVAIMKVLINKLDEPVSADVLSGITTMLYERDFAGRAAALLNKYENGDEVDISFELNRMAAENMRRLGAAGQTGCIDESIDDILLDFAEDRGLKLPTNILRSHVGGLSGGDSVLISARPDKGKTSLVAQILTTFAPQLEGLGLAGRPMLWFNNEGSGRRIIPRIYQAACYLTFPEMCSMSNEKKLQPLYDEKMHGQSIKVADKHGATLGDLERVIEELNPCVVVYDMLANFKMHGGQGGKRSEVIEDLAQEVREMAVRHDHVCLATAQVSVEGDNVLYPPYGAIKDSKTAIQGAVDVMIMMGALNNEIMDEVRGLSTPKNKRQIAGTPGYCQGEVFFDKGRCVFEDGN